MPSTLREFSNGYISQAKSSFLPILKTQPQQEKIGKEEKSGENGETSQNGKKEQDKKKNSKENSKNGESGGQNPNNQNENEDKPVFSAGETALFVKGKMVGSLSKEETFAFNAVKTKLKLAPYTVEKNGSACTLNIKNNRAKSKLRLSGDTPTFQIQLTLSAGLLDCSSALAIKNAKDVGDVPQDVFPNAEELLKSQIESAFEKSQSCGCDIFSLHATLQKQNGKLSKRFQENLLPSTKLEVAIKFKNVR